MNLYPFFPYFVIDFGEILYKEFPRSAIEEFGLLWKSVQWKAYFTWRHTLIVALLSTLSSDVDTIRYNGRPQQFIERLCDSWKSILYWIFVLAFHICSPVWAKSGTRELFILLSVFCGFRENDAGKVALFLRTWMKLHLCVCVLSNLTTFWE
jgi:hypothetical protein